MGASDWVFVCVMAANAVFWAVALYLSDRSFRRTVGQLDEKLTRLEWKAFGDTTDDGR